MINVTWTPPVVPNGIIVQRVNSSGKFYHYVPANQHSISLPHINDALVFVAAVNLYGQSVFERANSQSMYTYLYMHILNLITKLYCSSLPSIPLY